MLETLAEVSISNVMFMFGSSSLRSSAAPHLLGALRAARRHSSREVPRDPDDGCDGQSESQRRRR